MTKLRYKDGSGNWVSIAPSQKEHDDLKSQLAQTERQTTTLSVGVAVVNAELNAPARVEIEGRTLVSLGNTPLEPGKKYVLADKKAKLKWADASVTQGVAKFAGKNERPAIIRIADFEGKVTNSLIESPNTGKFKTSNTSAPNISTTEFTTAEYGQSSKLDGTLLTKSTSVNGQLAGDERSYNLIEIVERSIGKIPRSTIANKIQWIKENVQDIKINAHGFGSSPSGNRADLLVWNGVSWTDVVSHTSSIVAPLTITMSSLVDKIDINGFTHILFHGQASNGTVSSSISVDYIQFEIELKPTADFTHPKVPLYEVTDESYNKILVDWDEMAVLSRYPVVSGVQHLQGVGVFAGGDNLAPLPINENYNQGTGVAPNDNLWVNGKLEVVNGSTNHQGKGFVIDVIPGQPYTLNFKSEVASDGVSPRLIIGYSSTSTELSTFAPSGIVFTPTKSPIYAKFLRNGTANVSSPVKFWDIMLTLGTTVKPFVPRNPSYVIVDVKLGAIGDVRDTLAPGDNNTWLLTNRVEKDVVLDGSLAWILTTVSAGMKLANAPISSFVSFRKGIVTKHDGLLLQNGTTTPDKPDIALADSNLSGFVRIATSDTDTGFGGAFAPSAAELKAFFYGYKMNNGTFGTNYDGVGTKTWIPIGDTSNARAVTVVPTSASPSQLDGTIQPYKLSYVLATPQTIDVTDKVEGALKVNGLTQVETLAGIIQEKVTFDSGTKKGVTAKSSKRILSIRKGATSEPFKTYALNGQVYPELVNAVEAGKDYYVTYTTTTTNYSVNPTNVKLTYAKNIRGAMDDTVNQVQDNSTMLSVHEKSILDLYIRLRALEVKP